MATTPIPTQLFDNAIVLGAALERWAARGGGKPSTATRQAANEAATAIDAMLRELQVLAGQLSSDRIATYRHTTGVTAMDVTNTRLTDDDRRIIAKARALAETIGHDDTADALGYGHGLDSAILWPAAFAVAQTALHQLAGIITRLAGDDG